MFLVTFHIHLYFHSSVAFGVTDSLAIIILDVRIVFNYHGEDVFLCLTLVQML